MSENTGERDPNKLESREQKIDIITGRVKITQEVIITPSGKKLAFDGYQTADDHYDLYYGKYNIHGGVAIWTDLDGSVFLRKVKPEEHDAFVKTIEGEPWNYQQKSMDVPFSNAGDRFEDDLVQAIWAKS